MKVGYIRVSTEEQNTARQDESMSRLGVERVFVDKRSGKNTERVELQRMLSFVREGDVVVVDSISRFARNTKDLLELVDTLKSKGVEFVSLKENIDTHTPSGQFMLTVFAALAQLERETIRATQAEGIAEAKKRGAYKGRKPIEVDEEQFAALYRELKQGLTTPKIIQKKLGIKPNTYYRRTAEYEEKHGINI